MSTPVLYEGERIIDQEGSYDGLADHLARDGTQAQLQWVSLCDERALERGGSSRRRGRMGLGLTWREVDADGERCWPTRFIPLTSLVRDELMHDLHDDGTMRDVDAFAARVHRAVDTARAQVHRVALRRQRQTTGPRATAARRTPH